jgi:hypothetical protein
MRAVIVQDLKDVYNPERAGKSEVACFKPLVNTLESLMEKSYGNQRQVFN